MRIATRGSELALVQARAVARLIGADAEIVVVETTGDRRADVPLSSIGGQGVFVKEVQAAVLAGRADLAVHSAKDLPSAGVAGLALACVPERADPRDALVGASLEDLSPGGLVLTGSVRRRAQLAALRPDLTFADLRGNMATRIARAGPAAAVVVAAAALERLGRASDAMEILDPPSMLPQVAQGAIAVECREDDGPLLERLSAVESAVSRAAVDAERAYLAELGGGCDLPVAAMATCTGGGHVRLEGLLASLDGRTVLRATAAGADPVATGSALARDLLDRRGGAVLLEDLGVLPARGT